MSACGVLLVIVGEATLRTLFEEENSDFIARGFIAAGHSIDRGDKHKQGEERRQ